MAVKSCSVYERKDGRWEARYISEYDDKGKAKYASVYGSTKDEAERKMQILLLATVTGPAAEFVLTDVRFDTAAELWFKHVRPQIKESTASRYTHALNKYILPVWKDTRLRQLRYSSLESFIDRLLTEGGEKGTGLSPKYVGDILTIIKSILSYAEDNEWMTNNVGRNLHVKQKGNDIRVLSEYEQQTLSSYIYSNMNIRNAGILLSLYAGLRIGELCALKWQDISLRNGELHIRRTLQRIQGNGRNGNKTKVIITSPKSRQSIRNIPLPDHLIDILSKLPGEHTGYFLSEDEESWVEPRLMQYHFKKVLKECDLGDINFHALRHTFATRCVEVGFDIKSLSEILGHTSVTITMNRYVHPSMDLKRKNMQKLAAVLPSKR